MLGTLGFRFAVVFRALAHLVLGILDFESSKVFRNLNTESSGIRAVSQTGQSQCFQSLLLILPAAVKIQPGPCSDSCNWLMLPPWTRARVSTAGWPEGPGAPEAALVSGTNLDPSLSLGQDREGARH